MTATTKAKPKSKKEKGSRAAQLINAAIGISPKRQSEITEESGYRTSNNITMIKQGKSRVALDRVEPLAIALDLDPIQLMNACLEEYEPVLFSFLQKNNTVLTESEAKVLSIYREICGTDEPYIDEDKTEELKEAFIKLIL